MTEKLYYADPYIRSFTARVLSCENDGDAFRVILDRTAFYPGGGGQPADSGTVDGVKVISVSEEKGEIVHVTAAPVSGEVDCAIDFDARFRRMQNHTGEHIVSGLFHQICGANNVGFHMGSEDVTLDLDMEPSHEDIAKVEYLANQAVCENLPVTAYFPDREELLASDYRSKLEFPEGEAVRLVKVEGYDLCACSATHVRQTGEIGVIKFLSYARYKGGVRIHMKAGMDAIEEYISSYAILSETARKYSVKPMELPATIERMDEKRLSAERERTDLSRALARSMIALAKCGGESPNVFADDSFALFFEPMFIAEDLRHAVNCAVEEFPAAAAFSGTDSEGYLFVLSAGKDDSRELLSKLRQLIPISGGGKAEMVSGKAKCTAEEIKNAFSSVFG